MVSSVTELASQLISCQSITPDDAGCQDIIIQRLNKLNFYCRPLPFGEVNNLWATRGNSGPVFVFLGHTDVVPPGPLDQWTYNPFIPQIQNNKLYGRGAADMKGNLAAMIIAAERFIAENPKHQGTIAFLVTSDEEGPAVNGTKRVVEQLRQEVQSLNYCIVGEPSSEEKIGDTIKIGRRGSLNGKLTVIGKQGHVAYPQLAHNAIHLTLPILNELLREKWDKGNKHFPPTSFQISNVRAGTGATNVSPGTFEVTFNFRYSPELTAEQLRERVITILQKHHQNYQLEWHHSGQPFITKNSRLIDSAKEAIRQTLGITPKLSTAGGTSDGRFIALTGCEVIELGVCNKTIHQANEHVNIAELENLTTVYQHILQTLLASN